MKVILFYKYVQIDDLESLKNSQIELCKELNLKGRILIAKEGINGTVSGEDNDIALYEKRMKENELFYDVEFKENNVMKHCFGKVSVKIRNEIVGFSHDIDLSKSGKKIKGKGLNELYERKDDFVILDARNTYETKIGMFKNAITLDIENFRDFPKKIKELKKFQNNKIIMYCTGGVRCEKASALLIENGFRNVFQLDGGIIKYTNEFPDSYFEGSCFVFDERMYFPVNSKVISKCEWCGKDCNRCIDCCNNDCNKIFVCCEECEIEHKSGCSEFCSEHPTRVKWPEYHDFGENTTSMSSYS